MPAAAAPPVAAGGAAATDAGFGDDRARWSRQLALPGFDGAALAALRGAHVLVVGAGGLGSTVLPAIVAAGVGAVTVIDDDVVETSNLHRQTLHDEESVGLPKALSAVAALDALGTGARLDPVLERLTAANAQELVSSADLVVDGSDNFPTRYLVDDAARIAGVPVVWGAVQQYGGQAGVSAAGLGPVYRDLFPEPPAPGAVLSCAEGGILPSVCTVVGGIMAGQVLTLLTGIGEPLVGRVTAFDALTGRFRELAYAADPDAVPRPDRVADVDYPAFCGFAPHSEGTPAMTDADRPAGLPPRDLSATEVRDLLEGDAPIRLVDVREPWEAEIASIEGARLVPLGTVPEADFDGDGAIVLYCHHGARSDRAVEALAARGIRASHLVGGIDAWSRTVDSDVARY